MNDLKYICLEATGSDDLQVEESFPEGETKYRFHDWEPSAPSNEEDESVTNRDAVHAGIEWVRLAKVLPVLVRRRENETIIHDKRKRSSYEVSLPRKWVITKRCTGFHGHFDLA